MKKTLIILILFVTVDNALSCQCIPLAFEQEVQSSNNIFHGRVVLVDQYTFEIEIIQVWKGEFATKTFHLKQGETSCERRTFELNKEYIFYLTGKSVFNCSRTDEYIRTMDSELLDLKFKNIGDKKSIESNFITERELVILKPLLHDKNINPDDIGYKQILFAIEDKWVDKWMFFNGYRLSDLEIKLFKLQTETEKASMILWTGSNWNKSLKRLKKSM